MLGTSRRLLTMRRKPIAGPVWGVKLVETLTVTTKLLTVHAGEISRAALLSEMRKLVP